ncbi:specifically androgen-regulated gene protein [Cheilinus undulatus]|uniref:specifically androgen-regulated gene protein n=1 Tax=Cheilinus undulatus TaxID=241271 RepID=UPI001BD51C06|nr:specifically androgen-regulated gene protein [Cheilinus undulatus]
MPKSDTWPGGVALEALSNMDSAGSCDSVISMNSGYSEDSMEHLSPEERACLMYLEETIEALEVQEDSGLSNDEPEPRLRMERLSVNDVSSARPDVSYGDEISDQDSFLAVNGTSEALSSLGTAANLTDLKASENLGPPLTESGSDSETHPPASRTTELCVSKDEDGHLRIVPSTSLSPDQPTKAAEVDLSLIPPPSDFMDEPVLPAKPLTARDLLGSTVVSTKKQATPVDLEQLRERAAIKRHSLSIPEPENKPQELTLLAISSAPPLSPPALEHAEPKTPPAVAPKPKKLPANIILKSHKATVVEGNSGHSSPMSSDRHLLDPQKVRMEALRKLGLLKSDDSDPGPNLSPKLSPQTRRSWAAPSPPVSPNTPPLTPAYPRVHSPSQASVPLHSPSSVQSSASVPLQSPAAALPPVTVTAPIVQLPEILPVPEAFSDPDGSLHSDNELSAGSDVPDLTPPFTPPVLVKHLTPPKVLGVKSATLERSGMGLSSYMESQDLSGDSSKLSPSKLRNNRPRPASLGSGKEFSSSEGEGLTVGSASSRGQDLRRSLPPPLPHNNSQKLPRSEGISVLICPRGQNENDRREALKRLGLLRD